MEFKLIEYQVPAKINFNFEELKHDITASTDCYRTLVYTEDNIKEAKADRAKLNKLKSALDNERKSVKEDILKPYMIFEGQVKELIQIVDDTVKVIDNSINEYVEIKRVEKEAEIESLFTNMMGTEFPWLRSSAIWNPKWLNATYSMKQIEADMKNSADTIRNELDVLGRLKEYSFEASEKYKKTLDLKEAMMYADELSEMNKAKNEAWLAEAQEAERTQSEIRRVNSVAELKNRLKGTQMTNTMPTEEKSDIERSWLSFKVNVSVAEATKLRAFFEENNIVFERI